MKKFVMNFVMKNFTVAMLLVMLSGCFVYRIDIQQGNEITYERLAEIELGMTRAQVADLLGAPLISDPFHANRWDYYFYLKKGDSGEVRQQFATLIFAEDALTRLESSLLDAPLTE